MIKAVTRKMNERAREAVRQLMKLHAPKLSSSVSSFAAVQPVADGGAYVEVIVFVSEDDLRKHGGD